MKPAAVVLILWAVVVSAPPAAASCLASSPLRSANGTEPANRSFIWTASVFEPFYFEGYAPLAYQRPFTTELIATFWSAGQGDPVIGMGNDSGGLVVQDDLTFATHDPYSVYFGAELNTDWTRLLVDGCNDMSTCTCLLLSDADAEGRQGLFALVAAATDTASGTFVNLTGSDPVGNAQPIVLREVPPPTVTDIVRPQADTVEITVTVPSRSAGVYEAASGAGCSCGPTAFNVRFQVLARGSIPPVGRDPGSWPVAPLAGGGGQPDTPTDGSVTVQATCPGGDADVYLVTELIFDSGFSASFVSGNSIRIECGGNLSGGFLLDLRNSFQPPARGGKDR